MSHEDLMLYFECIERIEAHEMLLSFESVSYPIVTEDGRKEMHKRFFSTAYPDFKRTPDQVVNWG